METGLTASADYGALLGQLRRVAALEQVALLLNWDQETQMPPKGAEQRAVEAGAVAAAAHALAADPRVPDWCASAEGQGSALTEAARVNIAEARRLHRRAVRVPARLAEEVARETALAQGVWERARAANAFGDFAPRLAVVVALKREEAACIAADGQSPYDALLDEYEPGMNGAEVSALFGRLRAGLTDLRARLAATGQAVPRLEGHFPAAGQLDLARRLGDVFGYDWSAGRLDLAVHPSSSGTGGDVRITTRIDESDPLSCVSTVIHEVGHAVYEQGLEPEHRFEPVAMHASMGVHESQSRLLENQFGRSRAFCGWLYPALRDRFGTAGVGSAEDLYRAANRFETGFIRTEADEVHYNLHVMMRFDLERELMHGTLAVGDLEAAWNARFAEDFGREVPDARRGVLQDVHWSAGLFGYFPTYAIGNVYAAALHAALRRDLPDLDAMLAAGELAPALGWLRERIHRRGRRLPPRDLVTEASGATPDETALLAYLESKFGELYGL